jgi:Phosphoribosylcarboxyaminoimidazole (NCAIR) mutase
LKVAIVMGSASDNKIAMDAKEVLDNFDIETELRVISAHRTPKIAFEYAEKLEENGFDLVIAIAGKAAHLAGVFSEFNDFTCNRRASKIIYFRWIRFPPFDCTNA